MFATAEDSPITEGEKSREVADDDDMIEPEDKDLVVSDDPFPFSLGDMGDFGDIFQGFDDDAFLAFLKDHPQSTYEL